MINGWFIIERLGRWLVGFLLLSRVALVAVFFGFSVARCAHNLISPTLKYLVFRERLRVSNLARAVLYEFELAFHEQGLR